MSRNVSSDQIKTIYIVGGRGVWKTSLLNILLGKGFNEKIKHSKIGITESLYQNNDKQIIIKELTDDENFSKTKVLKNQLEEIILIIVVFAIDNEDSLEYAKSLILFIKSNITYNLGIQIFLFGNKYDSKKINDAKIKVNQIEAENYVAEIENCSYYDLSCKTGLNIEIIEKFLNNPNDSRIIDKDDINNEESVRMNNNNASLSCLVI